jgi:hypothetical protein
MPQYSQSAMVSSKRAVLGFCWRGRTNPWARPRPAARYKGRPCAAWLLAIGLKPSHYHHIEGFVTTPARHLYRLCDSPRCYDSQSTLPSCLLALQAPPTPRSIPRAPDASDTMVTKTMIQEVRHVDVFCLRGHRTLQSGILPTSTIPKRRRRCQYAL